MLPKSHNSRSTMPMLEKENVDQVTTTHKAAAHNSSGDVFCRLKSSITFFIVFTIEEGS